MASSPSRIPYAIVLAILGLALVAAGSASAMVAPRSECGSDIQYPFACTEHNPGQTCVHWAVDSVIFTSGTRCTIGPAEV